MRRVLKSALAGGDSRRPALLCDAAGFRIVSALFRAHNRFGLEITHNNRASALAFVKLQQENLGVPRPAFLVKLWRGTHPALGERIDFANTYHPWTTGEAGKYDHLFKGN